jgi:elongation factor P hydroxylase
MFAEHHHPIVALESVEPIYVPAEQAVELLKLVFTEVTFGV